LVLEFLLVIVAHSLRINFTFNSAGLKSDCFASKVINNQKFPQQQRQLNNATTQMNSYDNFSLNDEGHQEEIITPTFGLLSQSKRITKRFQKPSAFEDDVCKAPKASPGRKGAKYDTFDSEEQENLMAMLQKEVEGFCDDQDWHNALVSLPAKQYRPILATVIPRLVTLFNYSLTYPLN